MAEDLAGLIRSLPSEAFRDPPDRLLGLTFLERLRWLQETAYFVWKHKGAARARAPRGRGAGPG